MIKAYPKDTQRLKDILLANLGSYGLTADLLVSNQDWFLVAGTEMRYAVLQADKLSTLVLSKEFAIDDAFRKVYLETNFYFGPYQYQHTLANVYFNSRSNLFQMKHEVDQLRADWQERRLRMQGM